MRHQTGIISMLMACISLCGCTGEKLLDGPVPDGPESPVEVRFFATSASTRAESIGVDAGADTLVTDAHVRLYPYRQKEGVTDVTVTKNYTVKTETTETSKVQSLVPDKVDGNNGIEMILPSGTFRFYAVSTNSQDLTVPNFHTADAVGGVPSNTYGTVSVTNGVDYLYAMTQQTIAFGTQIAHVPLAFKHVGTQVQLTIKFGESAHAADNNTAKDFNLAKVLIQATSETNAAMHLYDGQIQIDGKSGGTPGSDAALKEMTVVRSGTVQDGSNIPADQVATYHLLPLAGASGQKMKVKIVIGNLIVGDAAAATHTYTGSLDATGGWSAGTSNQYTLTLSGTEIKFSTVTVKPWETGTSGGQVGDIEHTDDASSTGATTP